MFLVSPWAASRRPGVQETAWETAWKGQLPFLCGTPAVSGLLLPLQT